MKGDHAAWAFVVLCEHVDGLKRTYSRIGYAGAKLPERHDGGRWTAADAEACALINVADYMLARPWVEGMNVHCHFDAKAVGFASFGDQNLYKKNRDLSSMPYRARIAMAMLQRKCRCNPLHVHAHQSNPFNETADGIAGFLRRGYDLPIPAQSRLDQLFQHPLCEWAWLEISPDCELPDLQTLLRDSQVWEDKSWTDATASETKLFHLCVATVNVGTLEYKDCDHDLTASVKAHELGKQFHDKGWDFVCLQETRARCDALVTGGHYVRLVAAGNRGQCGVELWIHSENLRSKFHSEFDPSKDTVVWHSSPRILAVHINIGGWEVDILSCYAPQRGRPPDEVRNWRHELKGVLQQREWSGPIWICGDFNCAVGSNASTEVGDVDPDMEDEAGEIMHRVASEYKLKVANTFEGVHQGHSWTYEGPRGGRSRVDFILVSDDCWEGVQSTETCDDVDVLTGVHDHIPIVMKICMASGEEPQSVLRRCMKYDRMLARQKCKQTDLISGVPEIPWQMSANEHWSHLRDAMQYAAARAFPKKKRQKRQVYISEGLWNLVCQKKEIRQQHRQQQKVLAFMLLKKAFCAWKQDEPGKAEIHENVHLLNMQEALTYSHRLRIDRCFKSQKRKEWRSWVESNLTQKAEQLACQGGAALFQILQPKKMIDKHQGKLKRALPGLRDSDQGWCRSRRAIASAWQRQFQETEHALKVHDQGFMLTDRPTVKQRSSSILKEIPNLFDVEWALRNMNAKKAPGLDCLGAELFQQNVPMASTRAFSLFMKLALREQWAPELSGGWLLPLWKGKGSTSNTASYRGIMLEPVIARAFSRAWRPKTEQGIAALAQPGQWGGRPGLSCTAARHSRMPISVVLHRPSSMLM